MKRLLIWSALACITAGSAVAAQNLSLYASLGYGFGMGGLTSIQTGSFIIPLVSQFASTAVNETGDLTRKKDNYLNYGAGMKIDAGVFVPIMDHVAVTAGVTYTAGTPKMRVHRESPGYERTDTYTRNTLGIKALVLPTFRVIELLDVHIGVGAGVFFAGTAIAGETSSALEPLYTGSIETRPTPGLCALVGADYPLTDRITLFANMEFEALRFTVTSMTTTSSNSVIHFRRNATAANEYTPPRIPGTNWGLKIGTRFDIM